MNQYLQYVDTREIIIDNIIYLPFVFDKTIRKISDDLLITDKDTILQLLQAVNTYDIVQSYNILQPLYHPLSNRTLIEINGRWTNHNYDCNKIKTYRIEPDIITSNQLAYDMLVVYVRALVRDIPFDKWICNSNIQSYINDLQTIVNNNNDIIPFVHLNTNSFLRNDFVDEDKGLYWNQFQMFPHFNGVCNTPVERLYYPELDDKKSINLDYFIQQQNGITTFNKNVSCKLNVINKPRDIIGFVHSDILDVAFNDALNLLLRCDKNDLPLQSMFNRLNNLPNVNSIFYSENGCGFAKTFLNKLIRHALYNAWENKYTFMRIRPEKLAYFWNILLKDNLNNDEIKLKNELLNYFNDHLNLLNDAPNILNDIKELNNLIGNKCNLIIEPYLLLSLYP